MSNEEFTEKIAGLVKSRLGSAEVHVHNATKNNGVHLTGIAIQEEGCNISPFKSPAFRSVLTSRPRSMGQARR